jgi:hypothetical protein
VIERDQEQAILQLPHDDSILRVLGFTREMGADAACRTEGRKNVRSSANVGGHDLIRPGEGNW